MAAVVPGGEISPSNSGTSLSSAAAFAFQPAVPLVAVASLLELAVCA